MNNLIKIKLLLKKNTNSSNTEGSKFFKTGPGQYAAHDVFMNIPVPILRKIAKEYQDLSLPEIKILLDSKFNEERLLALIILVNQYKKSDFETQTKLFKFYLKNIKQINNWNLVDSSAHLILGAYWYEHKLDQVLLLKLAKSSLLWERRIAIVSTWYFIKKNDLKWTFNLAKILMQDKEDLMHKAVGWMLREAGKQDQALLLKFLDKYHQKMPRTMFRYAIEKLSENQKKRYKGL
ncbi:MAG: DNA alkylation repair protein [Gammaproteobacteria bacterium]